MSATENYRALRYQDAPVHAVDLHSLLDAIRHLFHHVYHEGLRHRLQTHRAVNQQIEFPSIATAVEDFVAPRYVEADDAVGDPANAANPVSKRAARGGFVAGPQLPEPSPLAARFRASKRLNVFYGHLGEQLHVNANRHLTKALCLSRNRRKAEAKIHARLAEAAVNEARNYLSQDAFLELRYEFEAKLLRMREGGGR